MDQVILSHLALNEAYGRKVLQHLKPEYFDNPKYRTLFEIISTYINKYDAFPSKETLQIELADVRNLGEDQYKAIQGEITTLEIEGNTNIQWLVDQTEKFCQERALHNAVFEAIKIIDNKSQTPPTALPKLLQDALQVSFDTQIGHDFIEDADERFASYSKVEKKIAFDIDYLNKATDGGLPDKTLTCLITPPGVGKTAVMCHFAAYNLISNRNVLYITMEMAAERIAQRIDANLLDVPLNEFKHLPKLEYDKKMERVKRTTKGKLIVKEYPTVGAGSAQFKALLNELRIKKNFVPDIIYIDYLNICISSRIKPGSNANSYTINKSIAEELRGMAVEYAVPIVTATQTNRGGYNSSDIEMENTADSIGIPMTLDLYLAIIQTDEFRELGQVMFKQLKNRLGDENKFRCFMVGLDRPKMRLYNVEQEAQESFGHEVEEDKPVFSNSKFGDEENERNKPKQRFDRSKFTGFR